jgi:serine/threonine protein kinase
MLRRSSAFSFPGRTRYNPVVSFTDSLTQASSTRLPTASPELPAGTTIGDFVISRKLGEGGMGTVYEALHPIIEKRVAIKVLRHELCANEDAIARFVQEARAVNRIHHPNIVDVHGFGTTEDGRAFLAMELLTGKSLSSRLGRRGERLTRAEACDVLVEVTHALEAAHEAGIVHRDLKPDNIFLSASNDRRRPFAIKLLDFGIAKLSTGGMHAPVDCTQPGTMIGTPQYIAPEQARSAPLDGRADIYSLGVVAFELFVGRPPFVSDNPVEMVAKHITLAPPAPSDFDPSVPEVLDKLIGEMLEKDPDRRPTLARVREVLEEIRTMSAPSSQRALELTARRAQSTKVLPTDELASPAIAQPERRLRWWMPIAALGLIAIGARLAIALVDGGGDDAPTKATELPGGTPIIVTPLPTVEPAKPAPPVAAQSATPPTAADPVPPAPPPADEDPVDKAMIQMDPPPKQKPAPRPPKTSRVVHHEPRADPKQDPKPADDSKPEPKPADAVKPAVTDDDNALRSPFGKKP